MTLYRETPCEHGDFVYGPHCIQDSEGSCPFREANLERWRKEGDCFCPGGSREEVTIDYEASQSWLNQYFDDIGYPALTPLAQPVVDAALHTKREAASTV